MRGYVVDASVAVEYLLKSDLGRSVTNVLDHSALSAPQMIDIEVLSAFRRSVFQRKLSTDDALRALDRLSTWNVERVSHRGLIRLTWAYIRNVSAYDSAYLATAKFLGLEVLTADSKLARAPNVDVAVYDVRDVNVLAWLETR
ncbi:MAG: type II toxin-antitoxin system VapC family toxin [Chloroflexi bacterium]|nr:type II toxin-antitoxin system VapC family toxin [Chloroflexota bacterium]